ncbi:pyridoxal 5'-phosphate synthase [Acididesulfobacillus acetoxydans]|uniref:Pyridoxal 5'-phosphate synthase n=1 Tax=Acididesulfobacillus acetoxydans TaxID=1561005 RepID=A0A8S0WQF2_9FIRM|nr:pyridoxamine 5'-phosphate oxidase family protein [Acididesulfobacillus acetoxydans]CAA7602584.1 pyridoxal 5'-phosphate synthase [Acididesulfobacillus acetoxydans]CEJ07270.1 Pyridoxamine 5'-phosphate oxidase [Acididesulfobacillus acetoxydans]
MIISEEIKELIDQAPMVPIATVSAEGEPHLIVVGKVKEVRENDILTFGVYKMEKTQQNIKANGLMQVIIAVREGGSKGYRLTGKASVDGGLVLFKAEQREKLL